MMSFPKELAVSLGELDKGLNQVEQMLQPIITEDMDSQYKTLDASDKVQHDLVSMYAINSLFWVYLRTRGEEPTEHAVRGELERVKSAMKRLQDIRDKASAMRLDQAAAHRMVSKSLWQPHERHDT